MFRPTAATVRNGAALARPGPCRMDRMQKAARPVSVRCHTVFNGSRARAVACKAFTAEAEVIPGKQAQQTAQPASLRPASVNGRNVLVLGWAATGVSAARLAAVHGASVLGIDEGMESQTMLSNLEAGIPSPLHERVRIQGSLPNYDELQDFDLIVLSPGVPITHRLSTQALVFGIPVISELAFAASFLPKSVRLLCVTGTNGKSTTASFLGQMLTAMGHRVWTGGNLTSPLSSLAYNIATDGGLSPHFAAVEVSSHQLEPEGQFSVAAASILNVTPDHLDRYYETLQNCARTQAKLVEHVEAGSLASIISPDVVHCCGNTDALIGCARIGSLPGIMTRTTSAQILHPDWTRARTLDLSGLRCPGHHNMVNAAVHPLLQNRAPHLDIGHLADAQCSKVKVAAFLATSVSPGERQWQKLQASICELRGLPHRMELVHVDEHGISWVNDSKATNVASVKAALQSLKDQAVVLLGGAGKRNTSDKLGFDELAPLLQDHRVITFGQSADQIDLELHEGGFSTTAICEDLKEAVDAARACARIAGLRTILMSPGCASFDAYTNFADRGEKFTAYAKNQF